MTAGAFWLVTVCYGCFPTIAAIRAQTLKDNQLSPYAVLHKVTLSIIGNKSKIGHYFVTPLIFSVVLIVPRPRIPPSAQPSKFVSMFGNGGRTLPEAAKINTIMG